MPRRARVIVPVIPNHIVQREYNRKALFVGKKWIRLIFGRFINEVVTLTPLIPKLEKQFSPAMAEGRVSMSRYVEPDTNAQVIRLVWNGWPTSIFVATHNEVKDDIAELGDLQVSESEREKFTSVTSWIRVLYADDPSKEHANEILLVMDFLESLPGVALYDPQKNEFF